MIEDDGLNYLDSAVHGLGKVKPPAGRITEWWFWVVICNTAQRKTFKTQEQAKARHAEFAQAQMRAEHPLHSVTVQQDIVDGINGIMNLTVLPD